MRRKTKRKLVIENTWTASGVLPEGLDAAGIFAFRLMFMAADLGDQNAIGWLEGRLDAKSGPTTRSKLRFVPSQGGLPRAHRTEPVASRGDEK